MALVRAVLRGVIGVVSFNLPMGMLPHRAGSRSLALMAALVVAGLQVLAHDPVSALTLVFLAGVLASVNRGKPPRAPSLLTAYVYLVSIAGLPAIASRAFGAPWMETVAGMLFGVVLMIYPRLIWVHQAELRRGALGSEG